MRGTLKDAALLRATAELRSLPEVIRFCESQAKYRDACSVAGEFWQKTIERICGNVVVLQRGDLQNNDWYDFAKSLMYGIEYHYVLPILPNGDWDERAVPYYSRPQGGDEEALDFYLPGLVPVTGTRGVLALAMVSGQLQEHQICFLHADPVVLRRRVTKWIGEMIHVGARWIGDTINEFAYGGGGVPLEVDEFPAIDFLADTVAAQLAAGTTSDEWSFLFNGRRDGMTAEWEVRPITF